MKNNTELEELDGQKHTLNLLNATLPMFSNVTKYAFRYVMNWRMRIHSWNRYSVVQVRLGLTQMRYVLYVFWQLFVWNSILRQIIIVNKFLTDLEAEKGSNCKIRKEGRRKRSWRLIYKKKNIFLILYMKRRYEEKIKMNPIFYLKLFLLPPMSCFISGGLLLFLLNAKL